MKLKQKILIIGSCGLLVIGAVCICLGLMHNGTKTVSQLNNLGDVPEPLYQVSDYNTLVITAADSFVVTDEDNHTLKFDGTDVTGNMKAMSVNKDVIDGQSVITVRLNPDMTILDFDANGGFLDAEFYGGEGYYLSFSESAAEHVHADLNTGLKFEGSDYHFTAVMTNDELINGTNGMTSLSADAVSNVTAIPGENNMTVVSEKKLSDVSAFAYANDDVGSTVDGVLQAGDNTYAVYNTPDEIKN